MECQQKLVDIGHGKIQENRITWNELSESPENRETKVNKIEAFLDKFQIRNVTNIQTLQNFQNEKPKVSDWENTKGKFYIRHFDICDRPEYSSYQGGSHITV